MGYRKEKRPIDARTTADTDLKFDVATSTGSLTVPTLTSTGSVTSLTYKRTGITDSTAGSTAFTTRGLVAVTSTSTSAANNYILSLPTAGEEVTFVMNPGGSTFGVTINASTATLANFGAVTASTAQIRATIEGTLGNHLSLVALSTARWLVTAASGVTFSTAAA